jgi:S1-C subfamily serine protease
MQRRLALAAAIGATIIGAHVANVELRSHDAGSLLVARLVSRTLPAVVSITTRQIEHDQFNQAITTRGLGSGVIVDRRGYILTNYHVVDAAQEIKVTLADERTFRGGLVGEFGWDPSQHYVYQIPGTGPVWAIFHRPGTHPYVVHVYRDNTVAVLHGVVEDPQHPWGPGTCGAVVMGDCLEP